MAGHRFSATLALHALAHVPGIAAAIAMSGCYNRTLTPCGFQYEHRTYWQAPTVYTELSPALFADRLAGPVLIITAPRTPDTTPGPSIPASTPL